MFESTRITGRSWERLGVPRLDLGEHLLDRTRREGAARRGANDGELLSRLPARLAAARGPKGLPHPLGNRHVVRTGDLLDFPDLGIIQEDLKALTHSMSIVDS